MSPLPGAVLSVHVAGIPRPQGSKRAFVVQGKDGGKPRAIVVDAASAGKGRNKGTHADWRQDVIGAVRERWVDDTGEQANPTTGPVSVRLVFALPRPAKPKGWAPHGRVGDVDKLARTILDALEIAGVIADDAQVCELHASKSYPGPAVAQTVPGVLITVARLTEPGVLT